MQGNTGVLLATMCRYDRQIFGKTSSSSFLTSGSLCRDIFWEFFLADLLEEISPMWECRLGPCAFLCVSKGRRLSENILCRCLNDWFQALE
jgi:hypothetical protein